MKVDSANFEAQSREAVKLFWGNRQTALARQIESGRKDEGGRGAVTSGKNMDGFRALTRSLAVANGLDPADVSAHARVLTLPGYFRPTKFWDTLAILRDDLLAAVEFKSQVGPSFGKNFNNWCEEAIGSSHDFWTAYRMGAFGEDAPRPFLAWIMLLEDCDASNYPVKESDPRFPVDPAFQGGILRGALRSVLQTACGGRFVFERDAADFSARSRCGWQLSPPERNDFAQDIRESFRGSRRRCCELTVGR